MQSIRRATTLASRRRSLWVVLCAVLTLLVSAELTDIASAAPSTGGKHHPVGLLGTVVQSSKGVFIRGWAYDGDTQAPAKVTIRIDGRTVTATTANSYRPSVARKHPSYGTHRGFGYEGVISSGKHTVCAYVVDYPSKHRPLLGCKTVTFAFDPFGVISSVAQQPGQLTATGWAIDPDVATSARPVTVRVDGKAVAHGTANLPVAGLAAQHPGAGANHGYSVSFPVTEGSHTICVKATNAGLGASRIIQCTTRAVSFSPVGAITKITQKPGGFTITGYATDPDTTATTTVTITADGKSVGTTPANLAGGTKPGHAFSAKYMMPGTNIPPGTHTICAIGTNLGSYGKNRTVQCQSPRFNWNPTAGVDKVTQASPGATITGWAIDPDTSDPISARILADGKKMTVVLANGTTGSHSGHTFTANVPLADGKHTICVIGVNTLYGSGGSTQACATITLKFEPYGALESVARAAGSSEVVAKGWAIDPDTTDAVPVEVSVDGAAPIKGTAGNTRTDSHSPHGFVVQGPALDGEHKVCVKAINLLGGSGSTALGCKILNAIHPVAPASPTAVTAFAGYGGARIVWTPPASDGGAPWSSYTVTSNPGGIAMTVGPTIQAATLLGLKPSTRYTFSVVANNVAGASSAGLSPAATTEKEPPAQTSPAPISTSRYIRNVRGSGSADLATMKREGAADAKANPSGHGYLVLLDIGGQDESRHGVILSAGIRFVSYADLVKDVQSYVDGYASQQRPSAPITIAIGTNNDIDVSKSSGANWANNMVDPVVTYAKRYPGITIAGANDIEPGFRASYSQTSAWLTGYIGATSAPFVFNGSADGCAWTTTNRGCNNGWTMSGLFHLAGGASPIRILNLPQIYNTTMAQQWRYISLTGVLAGQPKINFGGALTEYAACKQARGCGSLTATTAWKTMWNQLNAEPKLKPKSLPYSTDLRIDS